MRKINYFKSSVIICFAATFSLVLALITAIGLCLGKVNIDLFKKNVIYTI